MHVCMWLPATYLNANFCNLHKSLGKLRNSKFTKHSYQNRDQEKYLIGTCMKTFEGESFTFT